MRERDGRHCDRCGALLTRKNNRCGFELCDTCNDELEKAYEKIKNKTAAGQRGRQNEQIQNTDKKK